MMAAPDLTSVLDAGQGAADAVAAGRAAAAQAAAEHAQVALPPPSEHNKPGSQ